MISFTLIFYKMQTSNIYHFLVIFMDPHKYKYPHAYIYIYIYIYIYPQGNWYF